MVADFNQQWLDLAAIETVEKDSAVFPAWSRTIAGLMQQETDRFLEFVIWEAEGTFGTLLTAPYTFGTAALLQYYGIAATAGSTLPRKVDVGPTRAGLLTQGSLLVTLAKPNQTSPVHRGKFVREQILCDHLPPPPNDVMIEAPRVDPNLTTRERFSRHSDDPACSGCHKLIDPVGLGFEAFDAIGKLRATENGKPIDASGELHDADVAGPFVGVPALGAKLADSAQARDCVVRKWFRYGYGRAELDETDPTVDACSLATLRKRFAETGGRFVDLVAALTRTDAFLFRKVVVPGGAQ